MLANGYYVMYVLVLYNLFATLYGVYLVRGSDTPFYDIEYNYRIILEINKVVDPINTLTAAFCMIGFMVWFFLAYKNVTALGGKREYPVGMVFWIVLAPVVFPLVHAVASQVMYGYPLRGDNFPRMERTVKSWVMGLVLFVGWRWVMMLHLIPFALTLMNNVRIVVALVTAAILLNGVTVTLKFIKQVTANQETAFLHLSAQPVIAERQL